MRLALKAERASLLDRWRWTFMPDSPLSPDCQAAFLAYANELHTMTVRHETAASRSWPEVPCLAYAAPADAFEVIPAPEGEDEPIEPVAAPMLIPETIDHEEVVETIELPPLALPEPLNPLEDDAEA